MTDAQWIVAMIGFGAFVSATIIGTLSIVIGILNLTKKK